MNKKTALLIMILALSQVSCAGILADLGLDPESGPGNSQELAEETCFEDDGCDPERARVAGDNFTRDPVSEKYARRSDRIQEAIEANDIVVGMSRTEVIDSWGEPIRREVAGRGESGHERWTYGTRNSVRGERYLIFESGRVVGWHR